MHSSQPFVLGSCWRFTSAICGQVGFKSASFADVRRSSSRGLRTHFRHTIAFFGRIGRQVDAEDSFSGLGMHLNTPAMTERDNAIRNIKPQPRAFAEFLGGEEGLEYAVLHVLGNAGAVVPN